MRRAILEFLFLAVMATSSSSPAQIFSSVYSFCPLDNCPDGSSPDAPVIQGTDGNLYGTTASGGANSYWGTVFKMTPDGVLTTLYSFCPHPEQSCPDGMSPWAALVQASDGNFYGTTSQGGTYSGGTVFRITPNGELTTLHSFQYLDGRSPSTALIQSTDGNLYGIANAGSHNQGVIFKITLDGSLTVVYSFCSQSGCVDGKGPTGPLLQASDGNFYGTTGGGGVNCGNSGCGTVFEITPQGALTTLHSFNGTDGKAPRGGLAQGSDGNFYGVTNQGGTNCLSFGGCGTVFKVTPAGVLTTLYSFSGPDGDAPTAGLVQGDDANFYGTTNLGGAFCGFSGICGTAFEITPEGTLKTLHSFSGMDGRFPAGLLKANDGSFYGTTTGGGANCGEMGCGTLFNLVAYAVVSINKSGMGTVSTADGKIYCGTMCSHTYDIGTQITLSVVPAPGYTFAGWTGCDNVNGSYCSVSMTEAKNISATFTTANVMLTSLTFKPTYVRGGQVSAGTLTLNAPAPPGGITVALSSDHPGVAHPPSFVFIPGGKSSLSFAVNTFPVKSNTAVSITATAGSSQVSGPLSVGTAFLPQSIK